MSHNMTFRDGVWAAILFTVFVLWMGDRGELRMQREALVETTKGVVKMADDIRMANRAWIRQHEELKASIKEDKIPDHEKQGGTLDDAR